MPLEPASGLLLTSPRMPPLAGQAPAQPEPSYASPDPGADDEAEDERRDEKPLAGQDEVDHIRR